VDHTAKWDEFAAVVAAERAARPPDMAPLLH
jgi:hypothetical protein